MKKRIILAVTAFVFMSIAATILLAQQPQPIGGGQSAVRGFGAARGGMPGMNFGGAGRGQRRGRANTPIERPDPLPPFYDPTLSLEERVEDLVSRLTLEEKVSLMGMNSSAIPRLGIASYRWWNEALHGVANATATVFPQCIGLAATWDVNLHHEMATVIGVEARARNASQGSGLNFWAPNINLLRDPR